MSKALIFTDLHLHAHKERTDRLHDCLDVLDWVFKTAVSKGCDYIFFLGDLFHERSKIDVLNYVRTCEMISRHMTGNASDLELYLLVGNHDMYHRQRWDVNSIAPISAIPNCHVMQSPATTFHKGVPVDWMPYTENQIEDLEALKMAKGAGHKLLLGHFAVDGAQTNLLFGLKSDVIAEYDNEMTPVDVSIFDKWDMTLLGHYHGAQHLNEKVEYVGSPLQLSYGEAHQQKHILVLDLDTLEKEYVINDFSPKHLIVSAKDIEDENYDFDGNFVRLGVGSLSQTGLLDLRREFRNKYKVLSFDIKEKDKKIQEDETVIEESKAILFKQGEMLSTYVEATGVPDGLDEKALLLAGEEVLQRCENHT